MDSSNVLSEILSYYDENLTVGIEIETKDDGVRLRAPHHDLDEYYTPKAEITTENMWESFADICNRLKSSRRTTLKAQAEKEFHERSKRQRQQEN